MISCSERMVKGSFDIRSYNAMIDKSDNTATNQASIEFQVHKITESAQNFFVYFIYHFFKQKYNYFYINISIVNPITIYSKEHFNATHRLHNISLSEEENLALYGMCYTNDYHGHNYELLVKITGMADTSSDSFIDAKILKSLIRENITELLDQKNLNLDIEAFKLINPTKENIARFIYDILREKINQQFELKIFLYETKRNYVEYSG